MTDKSSAATPVLQPLVQTRILVLREQRVMLDADLAQLYGVETRSLVQAVKRNLMCFPDDFMIHLSAREFADLRSQPVNSSAGYGGRRPAHCALCLCRARRCNVVLSVGQPSRHRREYRDHAQRRARPGAGCHA